MIFKKKLINYILFFYGDYYRLLRLLIKKLYFAEEGSVKFLFKSYLIRLLKFHKVHHFKYESFRNYFKQSNLELFYDSEPRILYSCQLRFQNEPEKQLIENQTQGVYAALLKDVTISGESNQILVENRYILYDIFASEKHDKFINYEFNFFTFDDGAFIKVIKKNLHIIPTGIFIGGNFSQNFYHLMYEFLPKFKLIHDAKIPVDIPLLVDRVVLDVKSFHDLFDLLNVEKRKYIVIDKGNPVMVERLYYPSFINIIPPNYHHLHDIVFTDIKFDFNYLNFLRTSLLNHKTNNVFCKKIFLSRKNSKIRSYNEGEVFNYLEKLGFSSISPDEYSIFDQIAMFHSAEYIIGASGAAFTNILFCQPNCKIICMTSYKLDLPVFATIAKFVNVDMRYIYDKSKSIEDGGYYQDGFKINIDDLNDMLKSF